MSGTLCRMLIGGHIIEKQNMRDQIITKDLPWAAEGVRVTKSCDVSCYVTDSQGLAPMADAIMMEVRKFFCAMVGAKLYRLSIIQGLLEMLPLIGHVRKQINCGECFTTSHLNNFLPFYPPKFWIILILLSHQNRFITHSWLRHQILTSTQDSDMPITLICPWGRNPQAYLSPPPSKHAGAPVCDFLGHVPPGYHGLLESLRDHIKVDSFGGPWKNADAPEPFNLPNRIRHVGQYKFALVTESTIEVDW